MLAGGCGAGFDEVCTAESHHHPSTVPPQLQHATHPQPTLPRLIKRIVQPPEHLLRELGCRSLIRTASHSNTACLHANGHTCAAQSICKG